MANSRKGESDWWSKEAQRQGYPARSVFKLIEINDKFRIFGKSVTKVLDIGAAPGSWTMFIARKALGGRGLVVSCDLNALREDLTDANIVEITGDAFAKENIEAILARAPFDVVVSDAAAHTTGNRAIDCQRSLDLSASVVSLAAKALKANGDLVFKVYQGGETAAMAKRLGREYAKVSIFKPKCSRSSSFECFIIAQGKKRTLIPPLVF